MLLNSSINPTFYESDYNQVYEDALFDSEKLLRSFGSNVLYIHTTNILNTDNFDKIINISVKLRFLLIKYLKFRSIWEALTEFKCPIIQIILNYQILEILRNLD